MAKGCNGPHDSKANKGTGEKNTVKRAVAASHAMSTHTPKKGGGEKVNPGGPRGGELKKGY